MLFHLGDDPSEANDVASQNTDVFSRLAAHADEFTKTLPPSTGIGPRGGGALGAGKQRSPISGSPMRGIIAAALDLDNDGEISADELDRAVESLQKLDKNHDGKLSSDEFTPTQSRPAAAR